MAMTDKQHEHFQAFVNERGMGGLKCMFCGQSSWTVPNELASYMVVKDGGLNIGPQIPIAFVVCQNCGLMLSFSAVVSGVTKIKDGDAPQPALVHEETSDA